VTLQAEEEAAAITQGTQLTAAVTQGTQVTAVQGNAGMPFDPIQIHLANFEFPPGLVYSNAGVNRNVFQFEEVLELLPYVRADRYGNRVSGPWTGNITSVTLLKEGLQNLGEDGEFNEIILETLFLSFMFVTYTSLHVALVMK